MSGASAMPLVADNAITRSAAADRGKPVVELWRHGHSIVMEPIIPELVIAFRSVRLEPVQQRGRVSMARRHTSLVHVVREERLLGEGMVCHAGLGELVVEKLQQLGYEIHDYGRDQDLQLAELREPRPLDGLMGKPFDESMLELIRAREQGLIRYAQPEVSPARLIAQVALAFPEARIVCAATRLDDCFTLGRGLAKWINGVVVLNHRHHPAVNRRVVVGTYRHLGDGVGDLHNRDLLFVLNPTEMYTNYYGKFMVKNADQSRLFGFHPIGQKLTVTEKNLCTCLFGPEELVIPCHGRYQRPIHVVMLPIRGGPAVPAGAGLVDVIRAGIRHHPVRLRRIARLAAAIAAADPRRIKTVLKNGHALQIIEACGPKPRVAVLCGAVEQALELCSRLRGWKLVTGDSVWRKGFDSEQVELLRYAWRQPSRPGKGVIVTETGLSQLRYCDLVIRADAGVGTVPTHWTKNTSAGVFVDTTPAVLVDFWDAQHRVLRQRSAARRRAYLDAGWRLPVEFPDPTDQFFAALPQLELTEC
jgi:hypothetical protein